MSSDPETVLTATDVGKSYQLGVTTFRPTTLAEAVAARLHGTKRAETKRFWALRDVSFEIKQSEVVGIIGRNGAGKSTLLKVISQITPPTEGQLDIYGRVGSLLEVGTGFHPELTGRENIYLNGAILGMGSRQVDGLLADIVDFAGISEFLETPVKRYSSGMYVRLAFAVAAHLLPEILIVDEVLAVGDVEFQQRCLQRMGDVAADRGRTVLFVTHNLAAVQQLCTRCIVIEDGRVVFDGAVGAGVRASLDIIRHASIPNESGAWEFEPPTHEGPAIREVRIEVPGQNPPAYLRTGGPVRFQLIVERLAGVRGAFAGLGVMDENRQLLFYSDGQDQGAVANGTGSAATFECTIDALPLVPGRYMLTCGVKRASDSGWAHQIEEAGMFEVFEAETRAGVLGGRRWGQFVVSGSWSVDE